MQPVPEKLVCVKLYPARGVIVNTLVLETVEFIFWANLTGSDIVTLPEILDYYRSKGLSLRSYIINKNYALRNFSNYFFKIALRGKAGGLYKVKFFKNFFLNLIYPNAFLSIFYFIFRKIFKIKKKEKK